MIWCSVHWKEEVEKSLRFLEGCIKQDVVENEELLFNVEKEVVWVAYAIRKLLDAKNLSRSAKGLQFSVRRYVNVSGNVDLLNWHHVERYYDLGSGKRTSLALRKLCNEIVHSWVFVLSFNDEGGLDGFFLSSDWSRNRLLFEINIESFIKVASRVAEDSRDRLNLRRNKDTNDWEEV